MDTSDDEAVQRKAIAISSVNDGFLQLKCSESEQAAQSTDEQSLLSPAIQQRSFGHDLSRISFRPQAKLTVGEPGDKYEQEADWMANQVMRMVVPDKLNAQSVHSVQDSLQRKCAACEEEEDKVQTKPSIQTATDGGLQAGNNIQSRLNSSKGGGSPLPDEVRSFMEPRFGADFSQVRVHTGSEAVQMNQDLNAQAFTHKQDVYFGVGKAPAKDALTAHELTHVVQQTGAVQTKQISEQPIVQLKCSACENEEAEVQRSPNVSAISEPGIQRWSLFGDDEEKKESEGSSGGGVLDWAKEEEEEKDDGDKKRPPKDICNKAIKVLEQYERLAEKLGKKIPPKRLKELNEKRDAGTITSNDLPGFLEFPGGELEGMTLAAIRKLCGKK